MTGTCASIPNPIKDGKHDVVIQLKTGLADNTKHTIKIPYWTPPCVIGSSNEKLYEKVYIDFKHKHSYTYPSVSTVFTEYTLCDDFNLATVTYVDCDIKLLSSNSVYLLKIVVS